MTTPMKAIGFVFAAAYAVVRQHDVDGVDGLTYKHRAEAGTGGKGEPEEGKGGNLGKGGKGKGGKGKGGKGKGRRRPALPPPLPAGCFPPHPPVVPLPIYRLLRLRLLPWGHRLNVCHIYAFGRSRGTGHLENHLEKIPFQVRWLIWQFSRATHLHEPGWMEPSDPDPRADIRFNETSELEDPLGRVQYCYRPGVLLGGARGSLLPRDLAEMMRPAPDRRGEAAAGDAADDGGAAAADDGADDGGAGEEGQEGAAAAGEGAAGEGADAH